MKTKERDDFFWPLFWFSLTLLVTQFRGITEILGFDVPEDFGLPPLIGLVVVFGTLFVGLLVRWAKSDRRELELCHAGSDIEDEVQRELARLRRGADRQAGPEEPVD